MTKDLKNQNKNSIIIYQSSKHEVELKVRFEKETVWLSLNQIADLFGRDKSVISRHLRNIFKEEELSKNSVVAKIATTAADGKIYQVEFYNLDAILSVGYRVNSQRATQFRIWATKILKHYLIQGYAINENRLLQVKEKFYELQNTIAFLRKKSKAKLFKGQEKEILNLLADYARTLSILEQYDKNKLKSIKGAKSKFIFRYEECLSVIAEIKKELMVKKEAGDIFGQEVDRKLESIIKNLCQTFGKKELYQSIEAKAAHLLYLTIKDHPFIDGNKRIGSFLFIYFLDKNNYLYRKIGEKKINDNGLAALALLIAESDPKDKGVLIKIISNFLA